MKRKTLKFSPEYNFILFGLSATVSDIRLVYILKTMTELDFHRCENLCVFHEKLPIEQTFSLFECDENDENLSISLISNKSQEGFLIEELKNIDYFIIIKGADSIVFAEKFLKVLKESSSIYGVFQIDPNNLPSKQKLLFQ
ncbi:MAG: IPExxxVDY family protein [Bacteroidales bacterium]|nr:IPExxxVDY family protein [Bacteroidales bacterium]HOY38146.1 IPExxxVDY family protein [Bacteroidales bacterium]HQP03044.1 IPExxxVDY family protein [Bacteroidales bacterium]